MYGSPIGNLSGAVHLVARRPYLLAVVATVALAVSVPKAGPVPPPPATVLVPPAPSVALIPEAPKTQEPCTVEVPEPGAAPRQVGNCYFQYSAPGPKAKLAARVDNVCKHKLDDTVLYLKGTKDKIVLSGNSLTGHGDIAILRAQNVRAYLIRNGIDASRISITRGTKHSRVVDLIVSGS